MSDAAIEFWTLVGVAGMGVLTIALLAMEWWSLRVLSRSSRINLADHEPHR